MLTSLSLSDSLLNQTARTLPAAPQVLASLSELLEDTNAGIEDIVELLKRDAALCVRVISVSNSIAFGGGSSSSIDEAVSRIGFSEIFRLVGLATTAHLADRALVCYGVEADRLREHILCTALACEALAELTDLDTRRLYTTGLLRNVGMMVLDRIARQHLLPVPVYAHAQFGSYQTWEEQVFDRHNNDVAALLLKQWKFSPEIITAVRHQFLLEESDLQHRPAVVLNLAGWVANSCGHALPGEQEHWAWSEQKLAAVGLDEMQMRVAVTETSARFERLKAALY